MDIRPAYPCLVGRPWINGAGVNISWRLIFTSNFIKFSEDLYSLQISSDYLKIYVHFNFHQIFRRLIFASYFLKTYIHYKFYQIFWRLIFISILTRFSEDLCSLQVSPYFLKTYIHFKFHQIILRCMFTSIFIRFFKDLYLLL